jgi:hypothetical protein
MWFLGNRNGNSYAREKKNKRGKGDGSERPKFQRLEKDVAVRERAEWEKRTRGESSKL